MAKLFFGAAALLASVLANTALAGDWSAKRGSSYKSPGEGPRAVGANVLPEGHIASAARGNISKAWYVQPTSRYRHAILGDAIEAGGLKVKLRKGGEVELSLAKEFVFEDRTPRLMDLDGDGTNEIITLISSNSEGAAIAVYGLRDGSLVQIDQTPFIGRSNRWRNVAGIADYNGDGALEIAEVVTPHIGGTLRFWTWRDTQLRPAGSAKYFSNHAIGAREQRLSTTADFNGDGRPDLAVPGGRRQSLHLMGFVGAERKLKTIDSIRLRTGIAGAVLSKTRNGKTTITVKLRDGSIWDIRK